MNTNKFLVGVRPQIAQIVADEYGGDEARSRDGMTITKRFFLIEVSARGEAFLPQSHRGTEDVTEGRLGREGGDYWDCG